MRQRWKAIWVEAGKRQVFVFDSLADREIARIDGLLLALAAGIRLPERFVLDEASQREQETWRLTDR